MSHPALIERIMEAVTIPVMAKVRIGHIGEARQLQALGVDYIDESEVLTPADDKYHLDKHGVHRAVRVRCARSRRGAAADRRRRRDDPQQGRSGLAATSSKRCATCARSATGSRALGHAPRESSSRARAISARRSSSSTRSRANKKLPVVLFCAGGVSTPADAALMMELGAEGIFVGSGIFKSTNPAAFARAIVDATTHWQDADVVLKAHTSIPEEAKAMEGLDIRQLADHQLMASRGN